MESFFSLLSINLLLFSFAVTLFAGTVKGAVGFAMPLIMISGMGILIDPKLVVAGIILPIVFSNLLQVAKGGISNAIDALKEFWLYILIVCLTILIASQFVAFVSEDLLLFGLGIVVVALCTIQLAGVRIHLPPEHRTIASIATGIISGVLGGFAGTWGPTTILYLVALDTPKAKQFTIQGVVYFTGAVMLLAGHLRSGILNAQTLTLSAFLLLPAFLGMRLGFRIHDRIDQVMFRKATLWILLIAGANLVRRGIMG